MSISSKIKFISNSVFQYGAKDFFLRSIEHLNTNSIDHKYQQTHTLYLPSQEALIIQSKESFDYSPLYSIVVPAYETKPIFLRELVDSVISQTYSNWELWIADASNSSIVYDTLQEYTDKRIRYHKLSKNLSISENTNAGFSLATGDYIALLDHDDTLVENALYEMTKKLNECDTKPDMIYSDEDKLISDSGIYTSPSFKPDINYEFIKHVNYICHFLIFSKSYYKKMGGLDKHYDGAQDFEFVLRALAAGAKIEHIPKILYHWRIHPESTASNPQSKLYAFENGKKAIDDYLVKIGESGSSSLTKDLGYYTVKYNLQNDNTIKLCVLYNSENQKKHLQKLESKCSNICIEYIEATSFMSYETSINYDYILITQNNTYPITKNWDLILVSICSHNHIGAVGAKILQSNNKNANCGFTYSSDKIVPIGYNLPKYYHGYAHRADTTQNVSIIDFSFALLSKDIYSKLEFDKTLSGTNLSTDLSFQIRSLGLQLINTSDVVVKNPISSLPSYALDTSLQTKWSNYLCSYDPAYNPNLFSLLQ